jgi:hypothetical protein
MGIKYVISEGIGTPAFPDTSGTRLAGSPTPRGPRQTPMTRLCRSQVELTVTCCCGLLPPLATSDDATCRFQGELTVTDSELT